MELPAAVLEVVEGRPLAGCQIEITNVCRLRCAYCSRLTRHAREDQRFFMSVEAVERAVDSLAGNPGLIGITGGEPTIHPLFEDICRMLRTKQPPSRFGLWTSGGVGYERHRDLIDSTFGYVHLNRHDRVALHQPLTLAIRDLVPDAALRRRLIDNCWVRRQWGPTIGVKGAFFCEIAAAWDLILDGPGGFPVEPGWWKRSPDEIREQTERWCDSCGMAVPLPTQPDGDSRERVSAGNLAVFRELRLRSVRDEDVVVVETTLNASDIARNEVRWRPWDFGYPGVTYWLGQLGSGLRTRSIPGVLAASRGLAGLPARRLQAVCRALAKLARRATDRPSPER